MNINRPKIKSTQGAATADGNTLVYAGRGCVLKLVLTVGATARWYKFYDKATAPASTDTPIWRVWVAAGGTQILDFADSGGLPFVNGFGHRSSVAGIDTDATYTSFAVNDSCVNVIYQEGA
jgi:hypothetical protein